MRKEGIAIIGIGCRFPGGANDSESFWKLLVDGKEAVCEIPPDRWNIERFYDPEPGIPGKSMAKRGGFIDGIDQFDPQFFGISPREAPYVDPQQRLLLETAWEAIEDAGLILDFERGTDVSVFVGISHNDYQIIQGTPWDSSGITAHSPTGTAHSIAANRISYCLNLKGASVGMDTACSSALTAVHHACEHIWAGHGSVALAGGVTVMITPGGFIGFSQASMLSPDGHCKAFDASANGFVRGEGAGMVLLKKLSEALADGDPIHGVILGTAINQDGHTNGISLPSPEAQAQLVKDACKNAGVEPSRITFVEAHGTGTAVGDPIEAHALAEALCPDRTEPLPIGSVKTNLGHLETAAGVAGLVKAVLMLKHGKIPATLHFQKPNPHIDFQALKLRIPTSLESMPVGDGPRMVGVNSFGFGGANAHVIVAEAPAGAASHSSATGEERPWPIVLSAKSEDALRASAFRLSSWLEERLNANGHTPHLEDLTYTLGARRNHHAHRLTLASNSLPEVIRELGAFATGGQPEKVRSSFTARPEKPLRVGFVMSGQGPQWWGMGRQLMQHEPVFRAVIEDCDKAMRPWATFSLIEELSRDEQTSRMDSTEIAQPAIFAMQVALAELWKSWDVCPSAIVGHSVGEIAAACVAGVLGLADGCRVIVLRSRLMESCARDEGAMLAVGLDEEQARAIIARRDRTVTIAAFNGPKSLTLAGARASLEPIAAELESQNVFARFVKVRHPFHHPLMQPAADALARELADLAPSEEGIPFFSTVTGQACKGAECTADHWARGIRQPVQFVRAVNAMADAGVDLWLEISAHPALAISLKECLAAREMKAPVFSSARREREYETFLETALDLHRAGVELDFNEITPSRKLLALPAYAWDKKRWWSESPDWRDGRLAPGCRGLLDARLPRAVPTWSARFDSRHMAFLKDHKVENMIIFPAAGYVEMILEAGVQYFEGRPFVVEDFEIRKPLILPETPTGLSVEVTYDAAERTFTIQSRFEQGAAWSVHVVGSMRAERTESPFSTTTWNPEPKESVELEGFYGYMRDMGLRYGEEFRPIRELAAGKGKSHGRVTLSQAIAGRAAEYSLHPVLFDGALQVFSAGAATVEGKSKLKLPVRFARIHFLRSPGAAVRVDASVIECNDEFLEGRLGLYDESGQPCVLVDGFRAISVSGRRAGAPSGIRDLSYHLEWERTPSESRPPCAPLPLERLREAAHKTLDEVISIRGRSNLEATMAAEDDLAAAQIARGLREMGANGSFSADSLKIAPGMRRIFARLMANLTRRGFLTTSGETYRTTQKFSAAADSAERELQRFIENHPGHLPEGLLCAGNCAQLGSILRGEKEAVQVLFSGAGAELLDQFYGDGLFASHWMAAIASAVGEAARQLPEGRGLRILEVGAGTGGLTAQVLPLLQRGLHQYVFSDVSAGFFPTAMQKLAAFPEVECKVFDLQKPGTEQGFNPGEFDLVVGTNVIHAVADVRAALRHINELLTPGGTLVFMDVATPQLWIDAVFGLTSGWWQLTDSDLRPEHPLLQREQWEAVMRESGFAETTSLPGLIGPEGEGQIGLLARKPWIAPVDAVSELPAPAEKSWLVFADDSGVGGKLASALQQANANCRVVHRRDLTANEPEDWKTLLKSVGPIERIVYLWELDEHDELMGTDTLLHLAQALESVLPAAKLRIDLVTRGAQPVGHHSVAVKQAPAIGIFRVILNEHPHYTCRGIDLPPDASAADLPQLWSELLRSEVEREVALRGEARYVQRITRGMPVREQWLDPAVSLRLEPRERGSLDTLRFQPFVPPQCGEGEALIEVRAAGMNFRDVLKALGLYPAETPDARMFGDEVAGIVKEVGPGVKHIAPGDRVFGLAVFGLATHSVARATDLRRLPEGISFEEAATLPVVFMTSWHALNNVARMRKGESILVHAGAGGVGMAAIQIAQYLGVEVIATAGSASKRSLLQTLGVKHVIDSRRADFTDAVMAITNRRGVDVVLNSLAAEAIPMGLACLAEFGRFIEIGKRDIYQNSRIPLWPLRRNASFHVVAMDAVFNGDAALACNLLAEVTELVEKRALRPLPFRSFPASRVDAAFRLMAQGKHTGKVIVAFAPSIVPRRGEPLAPKFEVRPDGNYLITGAFGGFGKVLAEWLVDNGARHLTLNSRSGASTPEAQAFVTKLQNRGVGIRIVKGDTGSPQDMAKVLKSIHAAEQPLKGVFHLAMVIDDAPLSALTRERMRSVVAPKAHGAWLLHEGTRDLDLDCFVMFSSISSIFGNPAQGNYCAANAFLDALAHHRHALGLPALAVNWGVLGGQGYVARNEKVAEFLARQGTSAITPGEVTALLDSYLAAGVPQVAAIRVDWNKWRQSFRSMQENPLLERIFSSGMETQESSGVRGDWRRKIEAAAADEREALIGQALREVVGTVLRVKPDSLRNEQPLTDLGLDSLMGVEVENLIESTIGVALPPASLMRARTIGQIATLINQHMAGATGTAAQPAPTAAPAPAASVEEVDLDAISDEDVDSLLGETKSGDTQEVPR